MRNDVAYHAPSLFQFRIKRISRTRAILLDAPRINWTVSQGDEIEIQEEPGSWCPRIVNSSVGEVVA